MRNAATYLVVTAALMSTSTGCKRSSKTPEQTTETQVVTISDTPEIAEVKPVIPEMNTPEEEEDTTSLDSNSRQDFPDYRNILNLLAQRRLDSFAKFIHPKGVTFSPYAFISEPQVIPDSMLMRIYSSDSVLHWGLYDGSGDSINMSFSTYFESFVYNADYLNRADTSINRPFHQGNSLDNFRQVFPKAMYIDFHLEGSEEYAGMDWNTLRIGFQKVKGKWRVVALIHDEWTI